MAQRVECKSPKPEGLIWILNTYENDWYAVNQGAGDRERPILGLSGQPASLA